MNVRPPGRSPAAVVAALLAAAVAVMAIASTASATAETAAASLPETAAVSLPNTAASRPPNVLLIVTDDLGYNDISLNGNPWVRTPHIDAIAHRGARFVTGYSSHATCAPARAALMTGRFPQRFGFETVRTPDTFLQAVDGTFPTEDLVEMREGVERPAETEIGLPHSEQSLATLLGEQGYSTGIFGKWHLGSGQSHWPQTHGFDEFVGFPGGAALYSAPDDPSTVEARLTWSGIDNYLWHALPYRMIDNDRPVVPEGYVTDVLTDRTVDFIDRHHDQPFFAFLSYTAPHNPLDAPRAIYDRLAHIEDHKTRVYYAMVESVDEGVGRVIAALERHGLLENTLVIFTSDNGGAWYTHIPYHNLPYRGWKATFFEGGINVPFLVSWPERISAGQVVSGPASGIDVLPTAIAAAGVAPPRDRPIDGRNLLPLLADGDVAAARALDERPLFWKSGGISVLRQGSWKLQIQDEPKREWLFDLRNDPAEQLNQVELRRDKLVEMRAALENLRNEMAEPLWGSPYRMRIRVGPKVDAQDAGQEEFVWTN